MTNNTTIQDDCFNTFWKIYPRKSGKGYARKCWMKQKFTQEQIKQIYKAVMKQKESRQWIRGIIPNPSTWLNQGRWEDELDSEVNEGVYAGDEQIGF